MDKFRHLLSSIRRGGVLVSSVIFCRPSSGEGGESERMGKFRHLLSSIQPGRVWVSFVICCRSRGGGVCVPHLVTSI